MAEFEREIQDSPRQNAETQTRNRTLEQIFIDAARIAEDKWIDAERAQDAPESARARAILEDLKSGNLDTALDFLSAELSDNITKERIVDQLTPAQLKEDLKFLRSLKEKKQGTKTKKKGAFSAAEKEFVQRFELKANEIIQIKFPDLEMFEEHDGTSMSLRFRLISDPEKSFGIPINPQNEEILEQIIVSYYNSLFGGETPEAKNELKRIEMFCEHLCHNLDNKLKVEFIEQPDHLEARFQFSSNPPQFFTLSCGLWSSLEDFGKAVTTKYKMLITKEQRNLKEEATVYGPTAALVNVFVDYNYPDLTMQRWGSLLSFVYKKDRSKYFNFDLEGHNAEEAKEFIREKYKELISQR